MKLNTYTCRHESFANLLLWLVIFALPLFALLILDSLEDNYSFRWYDVTYLWRPMVAVAIVFLIHNYLIAPTLVYKNRRGRYVAMVVVLLAIFATYQHCSKPLRPHLLPPPIDRPVPNGSISDSSRPHPNQKGPKSLVSPQDFTTFSLLVFALGANLGIKFYFKTKNERDRLAKLERENLKQELAYLRYQVNPHFFMNTLNNIHALVDIDPERAKATIVKLSRFMRYLLYDCDTERISLQQAVMLLENYNALMRMRYSDNVDIRLDVADDIPQVQIAPLILLPFIENAFKHGVSYNKPSFIHISIRVEQGQIKFCCNNSKNPTPPESGGVGLTNVRKRLGLIYGDRYSLAIDDGEVTYNMCLSVPCDE